MNLERFCALMGLLMALGCLFLAPIFGRVHLPMGLLLLLTSPVCLFLSAGLWVAATPEENSK